MTSSLWANLVFYFLTKDIIILKNVIFYEYVFLYNIQTDNKEKVVTPTTIEDLTFIEVLDQEDHRQTNNQIQNMSLLPRILKENGDPKCSGI